MFNTNSGYSLSDIAAATGGANGMFGNEGGAWWIIILFLFCFMGGAGNGMWGNDRYGYPGYAGLLNAVTTDDMQNQFNFAALERQNNEIIDSVRQGVYDTTGAVKDMGYMNNGSIRDVESMVQRMGYDQSQCCCETNRNIDALRYDTGRNVDGVRYDASLNTRDIMKNDCENTQKILDAIAGNRMADMQNQINQLQLQSALCGVMRYPMATTYTAGYSPLYCNTGSSCGCSTNGFYNI